jgi:hypothetical protein
MLNNGMQRAALRAAADAERWAVRDVRNEKSSITNTKAKKRSLKR